MTFSCKYLVFAKVVIFLTLDRFFELAIDIVGDKEMTNNFDENIKP